MKMAVFRREMTALGQLFPHPAEDSVTAETPPVFTFLGDPEISDYTVRVYDDEGDLAWEGRTATMAIVPDKILPPGRYTWDVIANAGTTAAVHRGIWSFRIAADAVPFLRPNAAEIWDAIPDCHPRHLFTKADIPALRESHTRELAVLRRNVALAYADGLPTPPRFHRDPDALAYREYFGRHRDYCDRNLVACALAYHLLDDQSAGQFAKKLFLTLCDWNPLGPCSLCGEWGDEIGLSHARCFPAVYDLLYALLSPKERKYAAQTVACYARQCEDRLRRIDFMANPGNSHAGRLPAYLGEAALVLKDSGVVPEAECRRWLTYVAEIYGGIFPYFGTEDGGWAEGTFYATSYTKWYLPFFSAVARYTGKNYLARPFYRRYAQFLMHFCHPAYENHPFCDGYWCHPEDEEWPGFFAQNPMRVYGELTDNPSVRERMALYPDPEVYLLHLLDIFLPIQPIAGAPVEPVRDMAVFPEAGFASIHTDVRRRERDLALLIHATPFASGSHRPADQGAFAIFYRGSAFLTPSGYFGREYGTAHHMQYTNQTIAANALLIDGEGQPYRDVHAIGRIVDWGEKSGVSYVKTDLTAAYPTLTRYIRIFRLSGRTVTVTDEIEADHPTAVTYNLHSLAQPELDGENAAITRDVDGHRVTLSIRPLMGALTGLTCTDRFAVDLNEGVPAEYRVTMPTQYHLTWQTAEKRAHTIVVRYEIGEA
ncbi:MAG: heparinase II/III family protein [Eubacteriales bacterium]|nr:heparinase II/III family protein [Eubacteriales bacterium]